MGWWLHHSFKKLHCLKKFLIFLSLYSVKHIWDGKSIIIRVVAIHTGILSVFSMAMYYQRHATKQNFETFKSVPKKCFFG